MPVVELKREQAGDVSGWLRRIADLIDAGEIDAECAVLLTSSRHISDDRMSSYSADMISWGPGVDDHRVVLGIIEIARGYVMSELWGDHG